MTSLADISGFESWVEEERGRLYRLYDRDLHNFACGKLGIQHRMWVPGFGYRYIHADILRIIGIDPMKPKRLTRQRILDLVNWVQWTLCK